MVNDPQIFHAFVPRSPLDAARTIAFYRLRPWAYQVMRAIVRGTLSPIFAMWGWYDAMESEAVRRAFGLKREKRH